MKRKRKPIKHDAICRKKDIPAEVDKLAKQHNLDPALLRSWLVYPQGKVVLVAANGMKFIYEGVDDADIG